MRGIKGRARAARRAEALTALRGAMAERQLSTLSEMLAAAHTCDGGRKLELPIVRDNERERLKREAGSSSNSSAYLATLWTLLTSMTSLRQRDGQGRLDMFSCRCCCCRLCPHHEA